MTINNTNNESLEISGFNDRILRACDITKPANIFASGSRALRNADSGRIPLDVSVIGVNGEIIDNPMYDVYGSKALQQLVNDISESCVPFLLEVVEDSFDWLAFEATGTIEVNSRSVLGQNTAKGTSEAFKMGLMYLALFANLHQMLTLAGVEKLNGIPEMNEMCKVISYIAVSEAMNCNGLPFSKIRERIGRAVWIECMAMSYEKLNPSEFKKAMSVLNSGNLSRNFTDLLSNIAVLREAENGPAKFVKGEVPNLLELFNVVPSGLLFNEIGAIVGSMLKRVGLVELRTESRNGNGMREYAYISDEIQKMLSDRALSGLLRAPIVRPLRDVPLDWTDYVNGGFHSRSIRKLHPILKLKKLNAGLKIQDFQNAVARDDIPRFMAANNYLQQTPFVLNSKVFEVAKKVWELGGDVGALPPSVPRNTKFSSDELQDLLYIKLTKWIEEKYKTHCEATGLVYDSDVRWSAKTMAVFGGSIKAQEAYLAELVENGTITVEQYGQYRREYNEIREAKVYNNEPKRYSQFLQTIGLIRICEELNDGNPFYYVWTMDSRGRHYAVCTEINPQGDDLHKSLHLFAESVKLTHKGLKHIKLHTLTCLDKLDGVDLTKISITDRLDTFDRILPNLLEVAENPLDTMDFWTKAGEPWGFLAACFEVRKVLNNDGTIKSGATTNLPIAKDGSCNALQYCAALTRDEVLAKEVNLVNAEVPGDVYRLVANGSAKLLKDKEYMADLLSKRASLAKVKLIKELKEASEDGKLDVESEAFVKTLKKSTAEIQDAVNILTGIYPNRKLAKQPTMTLFYGATFLGMKDQGEKVLKDIVEDWNVMPRSAQASLTTVNTLITRESIARNVAGADKLMKISKFLTKFVVSKGHPLMWSTTDGLMICFSFRKIASKTVKLRLKVGTVYLDKPELTEDPNTYEACNSVSPNLIHSMDAEHMRRTVRTLKEKHGVNSFMMIHDSFAVHAEHCDTMFKVIREEFVDMINARSYESWVGQILEVLSDEEYAELIEMIQDENNESIPEGLSVDSDGSLVIARAGKLEITDVLCSEFFFA